VKYAAGFLGLIAYASLTIFIFEHHPDAWRWFWFGVLNVLVAPFVVLGDL
jgi:hypothetical protein